MKLTFPEKFGVQALKDGVVTCGDVCLIDKNDQVFHIKIFLLSRPKL
jgi:putative protein kinase ArgK-like GTPase of G3E family